LSLWKSVVDNTLNRGMLYAVENRIFKKQSSYVPTQRSILS